MVDRKLVYSMQHTLKKEPQVVAAYVVGSSVTKDAMKAHDFDLVVVVENKANLNDDAIYKRISHIQFPKDLDLSIVDKTSSPLFLFQIISKGKRIYGRSLRDVILFEAFVMHNYYDTAHMRNIYFTYLKEKFSQ